MRRLARSFAALLLAAALAACAATPALETGTIPPMNQLSPDDQAEYPIRVWDPWEGTNRRIYKFNAQFDRYVFLPVLDTYEFVTPVFVQNRVTAFFSNFTEFRNATNGLLQARPDVAGRAVLRLLLNTTIGVLGLFDVATPMGVEQQPEDFGQTLGWWGVGSGPFLMVPVLGPSNVRDFSGTIADTLIATNVPPQSIVTGWIFFNPAVFALYAIDQRRNTSFRYFGSASPFEYDLVRFLYTKNRELEVNR